MQTNALFWIAYDISMTETLYKWSIRYCTIYLWNGL